MINTKSDITTGLWANIPSHSCRLGAILPVEEAGELHSGEGEEEELPHWEEEEAVRQIDRGLQVNLGPELAPEPEHHSIAGTRRRSCDAGVSNKYPVFEMGFNLLGIAAICGIRICTAVVLSILCGVISSIAGAVNTRGWAVGRAAGVGAISSIATSTSTVRTAMAPLTIVIPVAISSVASVTAVTAAAAAIARWPSFEFLVLLLDVGN